MKNLIQSQGMKLTKKRGQFGTDFERFGRGFSSMSETADVNYILLKKVLEVIVEERGLISCAIFVPT